MVRQAIAMPQMKSNIEQDFSMLQCQVAATEIVDELFVRLWTNKTQIIKIKDLRVYLYTATKNASLNYIAKKQNKLNLI